MLLIERAHSPARGDRRKARQLARPFFAIIIASGAGGAHAADKPFFGNPAAPIFQQRCSGCHTERGENVGNGTAPALAKLKALPPETIYGALSPDGIMQSMAAGLTDSDRRNIAEYLTGRKVPVADEPVVLADKCTTVAKLPVMIGASGAWNGWSPNVDNARFQTAAAAGLRPSDVSRLRLKWAFGVPGGGAMKAQPTVALGRVFIGGDTGALYALDAGTGCAYWSFKARAGRLAPSVGPISGHGKSRFAVFFTSDDGTSYALDVADGKLLWQTKLEGMSHVSGAATLYGRRLYVPLTGTETISGDDLDYECCRSRGGLAAIDTDTGRILWKVDSIPTPLVKIGVNSHGKTQWGPSGASVWNAPTVDPKRGLVYVGTGNAYGRIAGDTSDAILAFAMKNGALVWKHQEFKGDAFLARCQPSNAPETNCPATLGPDWDFGGSSVILQKRKDGRDILLAAGKGGVALGLDPDDKGKIVWRTKLWTKDRPGTRGLIVFGGTADGKRVYYPLQRPGGGLVALDINDGSTVWTADVAADARGQFSPPSAIDGIVFTGGWDGILRAVNDDGRVVWKYDTHRDFDTINHVRANGGTLGSSGPAIANGMIYVASGYVGTSDGFPGNVLLAFSAR